MMDHRFQRQRQFSARRPSTRTSSLAMVLGIAIFSCRAVLGQNVQFIEPTIPSAGTNDRRLSSSPPLAEAIGQAGPQAISRQPYALILPGVLGKQPWDTNIENGLRQSGFLGQTEIYDWTHGPLMFGANIGGDRQQAKYLAGRIVEFQNRFPERPMFLIGHSGGCRMIVQTLESLPAGIRIERAIMLSPGLESGYDMRMAMNHTHSGIVSFFSVFDVPISVPLTAANGIFRGKLDMPAATAGFKPPRTLSAGERTLYEQLLVQKKYHSKMLKMGHAGGHFGATTPNFVAQQVAPMLVRRRLASRTALDLPDRVSQYR